jgi:hypothetical protein
MHSLHASGRVYRGVSTHMACGHGNCDECRTAECTRSRDQHTLAHTLPAHVFITQSTESPMLGIQPVARDGCIAAECSRMSVSRVCACVQRMGSAQGQLSLPF